MALKGNLRDFTFLQLLNLVHLAHKTGRVNIRDSSKEAQVYFHEGFLTCALLFGEDNSLAHILLNYNKLNHTQFKIIKEHTNGMSDKQLGLLLINANYLSQRDVIQCVQDYYVSIIHQLLTWKEGEFRFEVGVEPPQDKIYVRVNLENIILEGSRRIKEWEQLQEEIPSLDVNLKFVDHPQTNIKNIHFTPKEWKVITYIHPSNSIRQIARAVGLDDVEIRHVIYGLLQAGLVEIIRPEGVSRKLRSQFPPITPKEAKKSKLERISIIHRLITRIRSLPT